MAAITIGHIQEFDRSKEEWQQYEDRLGHFFIANGIVDAEKKRAVFLSIIGVSTYRLLHNLVSLSKPGEKSFAELTAVLRKHFHPTPSVIVERFKFHSRVRKPGESVATFISELRCLSQFCGFGDTLEDMIRDRLVCGINDDGLQKRLLAEPDLTFAKAADLAQRNETASQQVQDLKVVQKSVNRVTDSSRSFKELTCYRCGRKGHTVPKCSVRADVVCHHCGKKGHLEKICRAKGSKNHTTSKQKDVRKVEGQADSSDLESEELDDPINVVTVSLHATSSSKSTPPIVVDVQLDSCSVCMEVDTGASMSLISETTYKKLWPKRSLSACKVKLCTYSKEPIEVLGCCYVSVAYKGQTVKEMPLIVVRGSGPSLMGRNWLIKLTLDWHEIHCMLSQSLQAVLDAHQAVFQEGLGKMKGFKAKLHVDPTANPRYFRPRSIPYALRDRVEEELDRLVAEGTLEPVETAEWAAPIVPVIKSDKQSVRICGDFRLTVNPVSKLDNYPIPKVEDLFTKLQGGKSFTKLDMRQAYQQLELADESKKYVVISTHKGLFQYTRLPFGIASAPGMFQRVMENLLKGIKGVIVFIDDILIARESDRGNLESLEEVLKRLEEANLRLKKSKCYFLKKSIDYLGHRIDATGIHPLPGKVQAILDAPAPQSVKELKSYLGLISYYSKFLPNLSATLFPLYRLLRKSALWKWGQAQQSAFEESKKLLTADKFLVHYDSTCKLSLACDASAYGLGVVLSHRMPDGSDKPIGYASRTLSVAEQNYSQIEKEGLACIFGVKKFHNYLFGRSFQLITDHKPLLGLLKEDKAVPTQASARIKRWSLFLSNYEYTLSFRNTTAHGNADALSRLPLKIQPSTSDTPPELVLLAEHLAESPVTADQIRTWTQRDPSLSKLLQYIQSGWPGTVDPALSSFTSKKEELTSLNGCILWGTRVLIPKPGREAVLQELHCGHPGITKMRSLARMFVWWPSIDSDIEKSVRRCSDCQSVQSAPPVAPLHSWKWPTRPWARLHIDFAGPFQHKTFLVVVDAHSKWVEAMVVSSTSSAAVITELRTLFARFGIPEVIVSDNGTGFTSSEFNDFVKRNGIKHITSAPYHPSTNGLAERAVQMLKQGLKKYKNGSFEERIAKVLLTYRIAPHSTTGVSPSELLLGRRLRSRLDLVYPNPAGRVEQSQLRQKISHDSKSRPRSFRVGDSVLVRNHSGSKKWLPGTITSLTGPVSYQVRVNGQLRRCHLDQLRRREKEFVSTEVPDSSVEEVDLPCVPNAPPPDLDRRSPPPDLDRRSPSPDLDCRSPSPVVRTYPARSNRGVPPIRYEPTS